MLVVKHHEPEKVEQKKKHPSKKEMGTLSEEIFSSIEDYALKGVEDEYIPDKKKPKPNLIVDI